MSETAHAEAVSGIEAVARGLADGGGAFTTAYPGFHAHELADLLGCRVFSVNEKNALAVAWGASLAGVRTVTAFKNVGLNDAADPFLNAGVLGVNAGLVVVVLDDCDVEQSQLRQDSRPYADFAPLLWLEPYSVEHAYEVARQAPALSEQLDTPVVLRLTNLLCHATGTICRQPQPPVRKAFRRAPERWVVHPVNVAAQQQRLTVRREAISCWVDGQYPPPHLDRQEVRLAVGMAGTAGGSEVPDLMVFTLPLPRPWLRALARTDVPIRVAEHGAPYVAQKVAAALGAARVEGQAVRAPGSAKKDRVFDRYEPLYAVLREQDRRVIVGDLGGHTMDPTRSVDACLCYGCSVGVATGLALGDPGLRVYCVTGDAAFLHSGKVALAEAAMRQAPVTVILLDNGGSQGTGGQQVPGTCDSGGAGIPWHDLDFGEAVVGALQALLGREPVPPGPRVIRLRIPF